MPSTSVSQWKDESSQSKLELCQGTSTEAGGPNDAQACMEARLRTIVKTMDGSFRESVGGIVHTGRDEYTGQAKITSHRYFSNSIGAFICLNAVTLAIDTDYGDPSGAIYVFENIVCVVFFFEMLLKIYENRMTYFKCGWNVFDFCLVWYSVADLWFLGSVDMVNLSCLRLLRILRLARIFKALRNFKELWLILSGILQSLKIIFWVSILLILIVFVISIAVTQLVGHEKSLYEGYNDNVDNTELVLEWNNYEYFGTIPKSMMTLFNIGVLAEWSEITRPIYQKQPYVLLILFLYLALVFFGIMNSIIGVIVEGMMDSVKQHNDKKEEEMKQDKHALLDALVEVVKDVDADNDGHISEDEIVMVFQKPSIKKLLSHIPDLQAKTSHSPDLLALFDTSGNGMVSYEEFLRGMYHLIDNPGDWKFCELKIATHSLKQMVYTGFKAMQKSGGTQVSLTESPMKPAQETKDTRPTQEPEDTTPMHLPGEFVFKVDPTVKNVGNVHQVKTEVVGDSIIKWPDTNGCKNDRAHCNGDDMVRNYQNAQPLKSDTEQAKAMPELQNTLEAIQGSISTLTAAVARLAAQQSRVEVGVNSLRDELADLKTQVNSKQAQNLLERRIDFPTGPAMLLS